MTHTSDDMHDSPVTPAPVGEVLASVRLIEVSPTQHFVCFNLGERGAWSLHVDPETLDFFKEWEARRVQTLAALSPPSDTSGEAVAWRCVQWVNGNSQSMVTEFRETAESRLSMGEEVEPLYPASALAAAEARGVQIGLERAAQIATEIEDKQDRDHGLANTGGALEAARAIRSLLPAHKG